MSTAAPTLDRAEEISWGVRWSVHKLEGEWTGEQLDAGEVPADALLELLEGEGNMLMIGGSSALWQRLIGTAITAFDNSNARIGVGDSTTAAADTQTDLIAATNKLRKAMDATYPSHTDSTSVAGAKTITFRATFATGDANFAWQEWGVFNAGPTGGRMLNRKVESLGTKTSAQSWVFTVSLTLA
jgi:hypothetical protein